MASTDIITNLIAKDNASGPIRKVAVEAEKLDDTLEQVTESGEAGSKSIAKVGTSAQSAQSGVQALNTGLTALGTVLTYSGKMAMEQERQMIALKASYGDAATEMIRFAEELDNVTMFSDDDIRAGELYFSTLINNYDLTIEQVQELMRATADLASMRGVSFEDASNRVTAAIRGEAEAAEYLNLTMNQQAIDIEGVTLSMSNAEAAQFRYNALLDQAAVYQGTANEMMQTSAGTIAEWRDRMEDAGASIGNVIGPIGTMATGMGTLGIGIAGVTGSLSAMRALPGAVATGLTRMNTAVTGSSRAMSALSIAMNPWVLGATAAVAVGYQLWDAYKEGERVTNTLASSLENLGAIQNEMLLDGNMQAAEYVNNLSIMMSTLEQVASQRTGDLPSFFPDLMGMYEAQKDSGFADYRDFLSDLQEQMNINEEEAARLAETQGRLGAAFQDTRVDGEALTAEIDTLFNRYLTDASYTTDQFISDLEALSLNTAAYRKNTEDATEATTGLAAALKLVQAEGKGWLDTLLSLNEIDENDSFMTKLLKSLGTSEGDRAAVTTFLSDLSAMYTNLDDMPGPDATHAEWVAWVNEAEHGTLLWRYRVAEANQAMVEQDAALEENSTKRRGNTRWILENATAEQRLAIDVRNTAAATLEAAEAQELFAQVTHATGAAVLEQAFALAAMQDEYEAMVAGNLQRLLDVTGYGDPLSSWNLAGNATDMSLLAMETMHAATALDTVYRVAVGNTDAIGNQSDAIHKWAEELIGVQGEYSKLDDLVQAGRITGESGIFSGDSEYAQAQRAYNDIARENAEIQEHVLTIQAKQAPIIRDQMAAYEDYLQTVADMPAEQQQIALGWMDTTTSMRAMEFQTLAVAAATGQLGANGEAVFTDMITGAAQADPVLKALLIDMGLISEGADGTITVNLDGAEGARSEIGQLTDAIVNLIDFFDDGVINGSFVIDAEDNASGPIREARENLEDADGSSATFSIYLDDFASLGISAAASALALLDGRTATTTIRTIYESQRLGPGKALGGVVGYARGGVITELAEAGPEILHFASGGTAYVGARGIYAVDPGTYVQPNNAINNSYGGDVIVDFSGAVFNNASRDAMDKWATEVFIPNMIVAINTNRAGQGVM